MIITIKQLRELTEKLYSHLEETGHKEIELTEDYYWNIEKTELYNPIEDPKQIDLGQLSFDWEILQGVLDKRKEPIIWDLVPLSAILRFIGKCT